MGETSSPKDLVIKITTNDIPIFDPEYVAVKEKVAREIKTVEQEMKKICTNLRKIYSEETVQGSNSKSPHGSNWNVLYASPLVSGEGTCKNLTLLFDVSQYQPDEVFVEVMNEQLIVSARHEVVTDTSSEFREFSHEIALPNEIDISAITSSISSDGILTVVLPLPGLSCDN